MTAKAPLFIISRGIKKTADSRSCRIQKTSLAEMIHAPRHQRSHRGTFRAVPLTVVWLLGGSTIPLNRNAIPGSNGS